MRHEAPFPYGDTGFWHYASVSSRGGYPIGYCTRECTHATPEEAWEHMRQWMLDNLQEYEYSRVQYVCSVDGCEEWTQRAYGVGGDYADHPMCEAHRNRETYEREFLPPDVGIIESWSS